jgi:hypothetical protein
MTPRFTLPSLIKGGMKTPSETARLARHVTYRLEPLMLGTNSKVSVLLVFILYVVL